MTLGVGKCKELEWRAALGKSQKCKLVYIVFNMLCKARMKYDIIREASIFLQCTKYYCWEIKLSAIWKINAFCKFILISDSILPLASKIWHQNPAPSQAAEFPAHISENQKTSFSYLWTIKVKNFYEKLLQTTLS